MVSFECNIPELLELDLLREECEEEDDEEEEELDDDDELDEDDDDLLLLLWRFRFSLPVEVEI